MKYNLIILLLFSMVDFSIGSCGCGKYKYSYFSTSCFCTTYSCKSCPSGKYMESTSHTHSSCWTPTSATCDANEYWVQGGAGSSMGACYNNQCIACVEGRSQPLNDCTTDCDDVDDCVFTGCPIGKHYNANTGYCDACATGQYMDQSDNSETSCNTILDPDCGQDEYYEAPTTQHDTICHDCAVGKFQPSTAHKETTCIDPPCPIGRYAIDSDNTCEDCVAGFFMDTETWYPTECTECQPGKYNNYDGSTSCSDCDDGYEATIPAAVYELFMETNNENNDNTVNETECEQYANNFIPSAGWGYVGYYTQYPSGCIKPDIYGSEFTWNTATTNVKCSSTPCVQKLCTEYCTGNIQCTACPAGKENNNGGICEDCPTGTATHDKWFKLYHNRRIKYTDVAYTTNFDGNSLQGTTIKEACINVGINGIEGSSLTGGVAVSFNPSSTSCKVSYTFDGTLATSTPSTGDEIWVRPDTNVTGNVFCPVCPIGTYKVSNTECGYCASGTQSQVSNTGNVFASSGGASYCIDCLPGKGNTDTNNECETCGLDTYNSGGTKILMSTGMPDLVLTEEGCETYASSLNLWGGLLPDADYPTGCIKHSNLYYYWNSNQNSNICGAGGISGTVECVNVIGGGICISCPGSHQTQMDDTASGTYVTEGATHCILCPAGENNNGNGCDKCGVNTYNSGGNICISCSLDNQTQTDDTIGGTYVTEGATHCISCPAGEDNNGNGCDKCGANTYNSGGTVCMACSLDSQTQMDDTASGTYVTEGATHCVPCPTGYGNLMSSGCEPCPMNTYATANGCVDCEPGDFTLTTGSTSCLSCNSVDGSFSNQECEDSEMCGISKKYFFDECHQCKNYTQIGSGYCNDADNEDHIYIGSGNTISICAFLCHNDYNFFIYNPADSGCYCGHTKDPSDCNDWEIGGGVDTNYNSYKKRSECLTKIEELLELDTINNYKDTVFNLGNLDTELDHLHDKSKLSEVRKTIRSILKIFKDEITDREIHNMNVSNLPLNSEYLNHVSGDVLTFKIAGPKTKTEADTEEIQCSEADEDFKNVQNNAIDIYLTSVGDVALICRNDNPLTKLKLVEDAGLRDREHDTYAYKCFENEWSPTWTNIDSSSHSYSCGSRKFFLNSLSTISCEFTSPLNYYGGEEHIQSSQSNCPDYLMELESCSPECADNHTLVSDTLCNGILSPSICKETKCNFDIDGPGSMGDCSLLIEEGTSCTPTCDPGYTIDAVTSCSLGSDDPPTPPVLTKTTCIDINECLSSPCDNCAVCTNSIGDYTCNCYEDFTGKNCENHPDFSIHAFNLLNRKSWRRDDTITEQECIAYGHEIEQAWRDLVGDQNLQLNKCQPSIINDINYPKGCVVSNGDLFFNMHTYGSLPSDDLIGINKLINYPPGPQINITLVTNPDNYDTNGLISLEKCKNNADAIEQLYGYELLHKYEPTIISSEIHVRGCSIIDGYFSFNTYDSLMKPTDTQIAVLGPIITFELPDMDEYDPNTVFTFDECKNNGDKIEYAWRDFKDDQMLQLSNKYSLTEINSPDYLSGCSINNGQLIYNGNCTSQLFPSENNIAIQPSMLIRSFKKVRILDSSDGFNTNKTLSLPECNLNADLIDSYFTNFNKTVSIVFKEDSPKGCVVLDNKLSYNIHCHDVGPSEDEFLINSYGCEDARDSCDLGSVCYKVDSAFNELPNIDYTLLKLCQVGNTDCRCVESISGKKGEIGPSGETGPEGDPGEIGIKGELGVQGQVGHQGQVGIVGAHGSDGSIGHQGIRGSIGHRGSTGINGLKGETGHKGEVGDIGDPGINGLDGIKGLTGLPGEDGKSEILPSIITTLAMNIVTIIIAVVLIIVKLNN